jgi:hypothetical protein
MTFFLHKLFRTQKIHFYVCDVKKAFNQILACLIIFSFSVVISADYWRNPNLASIVILEIEPKKSSEKRSDSSKELKQELKQPLLVNSRNTYFQPSVSCKTSDRYLESYSKPHLSKSDLPPELV